MQWVEECCGHWLWCASKFLSLWNGPLKKLLQVMWRFPGFSRCNVMGFVSLSWKCKDRVLCRAWGLSSHAHNLASCWDPIALELSPGQAGFVLVWFASTWPRSTWRYFVIICAVTRTNHLLRLPFLIFSYFPMHDDFGAFGGGCTQKGKCSEGLCL